MNCKKGDLAIITRGINGPESRMTGTIVRVGELFMASSKFGPVWNVRHSRPIMGVTVMSGSGKVKGIGRFSPDGQCPDAWLRPIRDPGVDAVDETLIGNPVLRTVDSEVPA